MKTSDVKKILDALPADMLSYGVTGAYQDSSLEFGKAQRDGWEELYVSIPGDRTIYASYDVGTQRLLRVVSYNKDGSKTLLVPKGEPEEDGSFDENSFDELP